MFLRYLAKRDFLTNFGHVRLLFNLNCMFVCGCFFVLLAEKPSAAYGVVVCGHVSDVGSSSLWS